MIRSGLTVVAAALLISSCDLSRSASPERSQPAAAAWWKVDAGPASLAPVLGPGADQAWSIFDRNAQFSVTTDAELDAAVLRVDGTVPLKLESRTHFSAGVEVRALLRMPVNASVASGRASADFVVGQRREPDPADPAKTAVRSLSMHLQAARPHTITTSVRQNNAPLHNLAALTEQGNWHAQNANAFTYRLRAFDQAMPGWEESFRRRVEHDMASVPGIDDKWVSVRIELGDGLARFWIDDRLVGWKQEATLNTAGTMSMTLSPGVQLARFEIRKFQDTPGYLPIPLAGYANARKLIGGRAAAADSLPPAQQAVTVGLKGLPFVFPGVNPEGNDHIDVGRSLLRQANLPGYLSAQHGPLARWRGAADRDPARIQLRVPNGQYRALHLIAAVDGDEHEVPLISAMFYRPNAGFAKTFEAQVPGTHALAELPFQVPARLEGGKGVSLWLVTIPLDPGQLSSFADLDVIEIELTKKVHPYRSYPDPISYGYHQGGPASSVHVYAATLERVHVGFAWEPDQFGHVWQAPANPAYTATLTNHTAVAQSGTITVVTHSFDGTEATRIEKPFNLPAPSASGKPTTAKVQFSVPVNLFGYHDITATLEVAGQTWVEKRSLVKLAPDTRSARWTEGKGALFGYWSYHGGHHTPLAPHHVRLMTWAGARVSINHPQNLPPAEQSLVDKHWAPAPAGAWVVAPQPWAADENPDPAKIAEFQKQVVEKFTKEREALAEAKRPDHVYFFAEPHITLRLTAGNVPASGQPLEYTPEERQRLTMFYNSSLYAAEAVRKAFPDLKILIPWGDAGFTWPLLRAGFPKHLLDGQGIDTPGFERMPERQLHEQSVHRLYWVLKEWEQYGKKPQLQYCEGVFVPTEPGAVSWREQMDIYNRWTLINMAYGVDRFYSGWFAFDAANYYGAEHYGGCGIQEKVPHCNPKPAYAAYATMTDKLNEANFDGYVTTASLSTFALRFKHETRGYVYALWTLRGKRTANLQLDKTDPALKVFDAMNNQRTALNISSDSARPLISVTTDPSAVYVTTGQAQITGITLLEPDHSDAQPADGARLVADLGDGSWRYTDRRDEILETNHWGITHYPGRFTATVADDPQHGSVLVSTLGQQDQVQETMPWYNVLKPAQPIRLDGAPSRIGIWVKGASDWGRVIYILRDAKGERWTSIGAKDDFNADDPHSWSQFCFDGWRYLTFELPGHLVWDNYRKIGTTWWRADPPEGVQPGTENVVDLPLSLEEIIVEQRSHVIYANDLQPAASDTVMLGKVYVEYDTPEDAMPEAVKLSRLRMPEPKGVPDLPNPIADMERTGTLPATRITGLRMPEHYADGTRMHVDFEPVAGEGVKYFVWVSAHADGRGAVNMVPAGVQPGQLIHGLRPGVKLYYWITYSDASGQSSKPSPVHAEMTEDRFKEK